MNRINLWKGTEATAWNQARDDLEACWTCFRQYTLPFGWLDPPYDAKHDQLLATGLPSAKGERASVILEDPVSSEGSDSADSSSTDPESDSDDASMTMATPVPGAPRVGPQVTSATASSSSASGAFPPQPPSSAAGLA